jgi:hypothetical protein
MDRAEHPIEIIIPPSLPLQIQPPNDSLCLLHYFEDPCVRIELSCGTSPALVVGSTNLRRANWVNTYATMLIVPLVFLREKERAENTF